MRAILLCTLMSAALVSVRGQSPQPATPQQNTPSMTASTASADSTMKDQTKVTMTGCIKAGTPDGTYTFDTTNASKAESYRLEGSGAVQLKDHVGHTVEVTGTKMTGMTAKVQTSPSSGADQKAEHKSGMAPTIKVTSVKHIAASCTASEVKPEEMHGR